jgi:hypothetical protein
MRAVPLGAVGETGSFRTRGEARERTRLGSRLAILFIEPQLGSEARQMAYLLLLVLLFAAALIWSAVQLGTVTRIIATGFAEVVF